MRNLRAESEQAEGTWSGGFRTERKERLFGLESKTPLVTGLAGIGTEVARRTHELDMRVIATRYSSREGTDYVGYVGVADE